MKKVLIVIACLIVAAFYACKSNSEISTQKNSLYSVAGIAVHGHRGDRGNFPENSIPAFLSAVKKGVDVLELDVVISKDKKVVVSHEPYMSSLFVTNPSGNAVSKSEERFFNLFEMTYDSIRSFDVGSRGNRLFPHQEKLTTYKPLLKEVIDTIEAFTANKGLPPMYYNIELKSVKSEYGKFQPHPDEFVELVMKLIIEKGIERNVYIQSFDPFLLNIINQKFPGIKTAYLVSKEGIEHNLSLLDFTPSVYSPNFKLVKNKQFVDSIKALEMQIIPWTVNEKKDIQNMLFLGINGIITDYPERVLQLK